LPKTPTLRQIEFVSPFSRTKV
jgi:hypothetical protein